MRAEVSSLVGRDETTKEANMEICILKFSGTHDAEMALNEVVDAQADRKPWLHQIGVVRRPLIGKISISATYDDDQTVEVKQGDFASTAMDAGAMTGYFIGSLVGPLHADMAALEGSLRAEAAAGALEDKLMRVDDIKQVLPRGSSALVLIATPEINDQMVEMFAPYAPQVVRRDVAEEVEQRLRTFEQRARAAQQQVST
jgi:uncharacterized membrane protein